MGVYFAPSVPTDEWAEVSVEGDDVLEIGDVPHGWLFPPMAAEESASPLRVDMYLALADAGTR